jgi:hypothetical protein
MKRSLSKRSRVLRGVAAYGVGAALVLFGVEVGSPSVPEARAASPLRYWNDGEMPGFPGGMEYPLGEGMAVNGVPLRMTYFEVRVDPDQLRRHYVEALEARGLVVHVTPGAGGGWTVTALSEDGRSEIVVAIMGQGAKRSLVFPSIVPLLGSPSSSESQKLLDDLPLSPAAMGALTVTSSDRPGEAVITYQEPSQLAGATATFIRDEMGRRGWRLAEFVGPGPKHPGWTIDGGHAGQYARFQVMPWPASDVGATVAVQLAAHPIQETP